MKTLYNNFFIIAIIFLLAIIYALNPIKPTINESFEQPMTMSQISVLHKNFGKNTQLTIHADTFSHNFKEKTTLISPVEATLIQDKTTWHLSADRATDSETSLILEGNVKAVNHLEPNPFRFQTQRLIIDKTKQNAIIPLPLILTQTYGNRHCLISKASSGEYQLDGTVLTLNQQSQKLLNHPCSFKPPHQTEV